MANKPGKKETAPRSTVSVYKRESFPVSKKISPRAKASTSSSPSRVVKTKAVSTTARTKKIVPVKRVITKKKPAKTELIKSIYHGHDFGTDEVVREVDLAKARRRASNPPPKENIPEIISADDPVTLPSAVNERLLSKQKALNEWYKKVFPRHVARLLSVAGLAFVLAGAAGLVPFIAKVYPNWPAFQRALVCEFKLCDEGAATDSQTNDLSSLTLSQTPKAAVSFLTNPAAVLTATSSFVVRAEYVADIQVYAERDDTGELILLRTDETPTGADYNAQIDPAGISPGKYHVRVLVKAARDLTKVWFTGPTFTVEGLAQSVNDFEITTTDSDGENALSGSIASSSVGTDEGDDIAEAPLADDKDNIKYQVRNSLLSLSVVAPGATQVSLAAESVSATKPIWLGVARRSLAGDWHLEYQLNNLPQGSYELVATAYSGTRVESTARRFFDHTSIADSPDATSTPDVLGTEEALGRLFESPDSFPDRKQYLSDLRSELEIAPTTWAVLLNEESDLNTLFLRYASVALSNNESLLNLADVVVNEELDALATRAALSGEGVLAYPVRRQELADAWEHIKVKIEGYEQRLAERSGRSSLGDADGDGISDHDEYKYYGTNIFSSDTDGDGVIDAVEVVRGFDPTSNRPEALTIYDSSPTKVTPLSDRLAVTGVLPVIETDGNRGVPAVTAEVTGKAPPHSLVTLFLENDQTVLTVRADDSGSFVYPFVKAIPDGEHSLYAALLDNEGRIIIKSESYGFTKAHELFVPRGDGMVATAVAAEVWSPTTSDLANIIIALCVMLLGLGALFIGYRMLREKDEDPEVVTGGTQ